ncbi:MAG: hypothetical protein IT204_15790 [Fimbriimonadaceae bacterium]|nr:hypothetical protein [Fimbriimonadaceae bacterium]
MRRIVRWLLIVAVSGPVWLPGCGAGLTGGSIPPGPTRAVGLIVRGDNANVTLPGTTVRFQPVSASRLTDDQTNPPDPPDWDDGGGGGSGGGGSGGGGTNVGGEVPGTVKVTSSASGEFSATSFPTGAVRVVISPLAATGLTTSIYTLNVGEADEYYIVSAPLPGGLSYNGLSDVTVAPEQINLRVGQAVQIQVALAGGAPPAIVPSYILRGGVGVITAHGRFTAVRAGRGQLRVILGPYERTIAVTISDAL